MSLSVAAAWPISARTQPTDPNVELMKKLYTKIGQSVGVGSNDPIAGESFLVLANPGILLDPKLDVTTVAGRATLAAVVDKVLIADWIYKTANVGIYDVYSKIMDYHEAAVVVPTQAQKQQYNTACKLVFSDCNEAQPGNYTNGYNRYIAYQTALAAASKSAIDYQNAKNTDDLPPDIENTLDQATNNYELLGGRVAIEAARSTINTFEHIDPNAYWGELQGRLLKNSVNAGLVKGPKYDFYPGYPTWLDPTLSWSGLSFSQSDLEQTTHNSQSSVGGGLSAGWGLWSVGADYSHQENRTYFQLSVSGYKVGMELTRVVINRPWLDTSVFSSRAWKWLPASPYDKQLISDGGDAPAGKTPAGIMPFLPTGLLLARKVSLTGSWSTDLKTSFDSHTSGKASIGWGPFSFGGRYDAKDATTYHKATAAGNTVSWDAPQILGFFVQVLPKSPNTDPCYKFASSPQPLPPSCQQHLFAQALPRGRLESAALLATAKRILSAYRARHPG